LAPSASSAFLAPSASSASPASGKPHAKLLSSASSLNLGVGQSDAPPLVVEKVCVCVLER
jgi:hypothetical protein